jgi:hypothetical protein
MYRNEIDNEMLPLVGGNVTFIVSTVYCNSFILHSRMKITN